MCLPHINLNPDFDGFQLSVIQDEIAASKEIKHTKRKADGYIYDVLNWLNEMGFSTAAVPSISLKKPRKSILTKKEIEFVHSGAVVKLRKFFWDTWLASSTNAGVDQESLFPFAVAFSASCEAGFGKPIIYSMLSELKPTDLMSNFSFRTRIHPDDKSDKYSILYLPTTTQFILTSFLLKKPKWLQEKYLFLNDSKSSSRKERRKKALKLLSDMYKEFIKDFKKEHPTVTAPETWEQFGSVAPLITVLNRKIGLEPYIATVQSGYALPVAHPRELACALTTDENNAFGKRRVNWNGIETFKAKKSLSAVAVKELPVESIDDNDWCGKSKLVIKVLCKKVKSTVKEHQKIAADGVTAKVAQLIDEAKAEADKITDNPKSALHLALNWIESKATGSNPIAASTFHDYLYRVFYNGLLNDPDSVNLDEWEPEDHELLLEDILSRDSIKSEKTRKSITTPYLQAYKYGSDHGYFSDVNLKYIQQEWGGGTPRNEVIDLKDFDSFIKIVMEKDDPSHFMHMLAVVCLMAYYGCMRSGEISRLTLKDMDISQDFLWIDILKGKSASARRRVPYHLLAPEYAQKIISDYYAYRRAQFRDDAHLKGIALFGPEKNRNRFTRNALADEAIKLLQSFFGKSFVLHSLRHSGCSFLLLRMYSARYPAMTDSLVVRDHEIFSSEYRSRAAYLFSGKSVDEIPNYCGSSLIRLSKLMGHLGQQTTFRTYIHTFHVIQAHAMKRISSVFGDEELNGKTIGALLPKRKSGTTRAGKYKDKTINALLDVTYEGIRQSKSLRKAFEGMVLSTKL